MRTHTINVFNIDCLSTDNYITSIEMPRYKQTKRVFDFLRAYVKRQGATDFNQGKMRFYVFQSNTFVIKECDL